jgi:3',5'-cyclic AMP phosphodiesterase CpdA
MLKIAHISDLHLSYIDEKGRGKRLIDLLENIKANECNHIVVTGDIADNPLKEDLVYAREIFAEYDLVNKDTMSVVPGNHDIYGSAPSGERTFLFPKICSEIDYDKMLEQFTGIFADTFDGQQTFPFVKLLGNAAIIGINSLMEWSIDDNPEGSNGNLTELELRKLDRILKSDELEGKYKIVMLHHHFSRPEDNEGAPAHSLWIKGIGYKMDFHKPAKFLKLLKKRKVNLVLHGHTHHSGIYFRKGLCFVNSSACAIPLTDDLTRRYNIITIPENWNADSKLGIETITL